MRKLRLLLAVLLMSAVFVGCNEGDRGIPDLPYLPIPGGDKDDDDDKPGQGGGNTGGGSQDTPLTGEIDPNKTYPLTSSIPTFFSESTTNDVLIVINAEGTAMEGSSEAWYAHTGVITSASTGDADWKYVKADWGVDIPECKLRKHEVGELWTLTIKGGPRAYYGVPEGEKILKLAFVFRTSGGTSEVKDNGKDIFVELSEESLSVKFITPANGTMLQVGEPCKVEVAAQASESLALYMNGGEVMSTAESTISYEYTPSAAEDIVFKAVATAGGESVEETINLTVLGETQNEARPTDSVGGVTVEGSSATFVLYAPGKQSVVLLSELNNYAPSNEYMMKRDGDYFWITVDGIQANKEYGYQYMVDGSIKVGDPYATKILDPWNDKYISTSTYPGLKPYPSEYTTDVVSVFDTFTTEYNWEIEDFDRPAENSLAIYELLVRDFSTERTINAVTAKLDYLKTLGINAIELMPIQEFDGNDSWGYNPCFYFAADKAYGTEEDYKRFIDECHKRDIAVILDVVFNHATGLHPWAKMWWNSSANKTASDNPLFNVDAPHNFSVFHDFKHTNAKVQEYFDDVLQYWLEEYNVDGFRFDLTKGFVQKPSNYDASGYSAERIGILKGYAEAIREVEPDAYIIFEHFCDQREENELYESVGALCWNNSPMNGYMESVMGYTGSNKSSFADFKRGRVNNIETHDEERVAYKAITYGQAWMKSDWAIISKRLQAAYAFHFLAPYPRMMWQFGELGYDVSINANESGVVGSGDEYRTHRKPVRWNYFDEANRRALYDAMSKIISYRTSHEEIYGQDNLSVKTWSVGDANMGGKVLVMDNVIVVANFSNAQTSTAVNVPQSGEWTNLISGEKVSLGSTYTATLAAHDYIVLVR